MIGQEKTLEVLCRLFRSGILPQFSIICAADGSGKRILISELAKRLRISNICVLPDSNIETVKRMIRACYQAKSTAFYVINDADNLSLQAKNALLKLTEEPPQNAYIFACFHHNEAILPTLRSRAFEIIMEHYSKDELRTYCKNRYTVDSAALQMIISVCDTPGDINELMTYDTDKYFTFVRKVADYLPGTPIANALKIHAQIKEYNLKIFLKTYLHLIDRTYERARVITCITLNSLEKKSVNQDMILDNWIMEVCGSWK